MRLKSNSSDVFTVNFRGEREETTLLNLQSLPTTLKKISVSDMNSCTLEVHLLDLLDV